MQWTTSLLCILIGGQLILGPSRPEHPNKKIKVRFIPAIEWTVHQQESHLEQTADCYLSSPLFSGIVQNVKISFYHRCILQDILSSKAQHYPKIII